MTSLPDQQEVALPIDGRSYALESNEGDQQADGTEKPELDTLHGRGRTTTMTRSAA
jgi:hypothetical protein